MMMRPPSWSVVTRSRRPTAASSPSRSARRRSGVSKLRRYSMMPPARVSRKSRTSVSVRSGPTSPNTSMRPTRTSRVTRASVPSRVQQKGPSRAGEAREGGRPARLERAEGAAALDDPADPVGAAEQIHGQALPLELVGRAPPPEAAAALPPRFRDQRQIGHEGAKTVAVRHVHLHAAAAAAAPLVEGGLEAGGAEADAGQTPALERGGEPRAVQIGRAHPLEGAGGASPLGEIRAFDHAAPGI